LRSLVEQDWTGEGRHGAKEYCWLERKASYSFMVRREREVDGDDGAGTLHPVGDGEGPLGSTVQMNQMNQEHATAQNTSSTIHGGWDSASISYHSRRADNSGAGVRPQGSPTSEENSGSSAGQMWSSESEVVFETKREVEDIDTVSARMAVLRIEQERLAQLNSPKRTLHPTPSPIYPSPQPEMIPAIQEMFARADQLTVHNLPFAMSGAVLTPYPMLPHAPGSSTMWNPTFDQNVMQRPTGFIPLPVSPLKLDEHANGDPRSPSRRGDDRRPHFRPVIPRAFPRGGLSIGEPYVQRLPPHTVISDESIMRISKDADAIYEEYVLPESEQTKRRSLIRHLTKIFRSEWPNADLWMFGSSANSLGLKDGDVDVCLTVSETEALYITRTNEGDAQVPTPMTTQQIVRRSSQLLKRAKMKNVQPLLRARVPIVKLHDPISGLNVDICVNNKLARHNTAMLKKYATIDPRMRKLGILIKIWAKRRLINFPYRGTLSSYAYILLVIAFLQNRSPPVLPCLQHLYQGRYVKDPPMYPVDGWNIYFDKSFVSFPEHQSNQESLGELLLGFFHYFAHEFDYDNDVVCVRLGKIISKLDKCWHLKPDLSFDEMGDEERAAHGDDSPPRFRRLEFHEFCIEDPFDTSHDVGRIVDDQTLGVMREEFTRAYERLVETGDIHVVFEKFEEPHWQQPDTFSLENKVSNSPVGDGYRIPNSTIPLPSQFPHTLGSSHSTVSPS